ncbi:hypothetical protein GCM10010330_16140 [Streptomyces tendae]|uniref:hypothetical protein n=1 Tax=Streptomyces tendae TaxID=1932 RepID=UPI001674EA35|nr:hypothetical protein [Streptomyces tendae]GHA64090.1 hypothetical protein GCM10010330_16140 [Streptomyces tendae]
MSDDVTITVHVRDLTGPGFNSVSRNINDLQRHANAVGGTLRIVGGRLDDVAGSASTAGQALGKSGGGLGGAAIGLAGALGASLLPAIGSLAPMLAGLGVVGGGAALAMDDLKKKAKELKGPFEDWKKAAEKAIAPHTERAVKDLKGAMKDLTPTLQLGAETFGSITERASAFANSPAFQTAFQRNAQMGVVFVEQFATSVGKFTQSFFEFGTKSKPALDAMTTLFGGILDTGLPGMFEGLEQGIGGSAEMIKGLASFLNEGLLPALGDVSGAFAETFGPLIGELLEAAGQSVRGLGTAFEYAMEAIEPYVGVIADGIRATNDVMRIGAGVAGSLATELGGALLGALLDVAGVDTSKLGNGFRGLSDWVDANEGKIRGAFFDIAGAITSMVATGVAALPKLWGGFRILAEMAITSVDTIVSSLAHSPLSKIPGFGQLFKQWNEDYDEWAKGAREGLSSVGGTIQEFATTAGENLNRVQFKLKVEEAEQNLASIKEKLKDPELTATREAELKAEKKQAEQALREAKAALKSFDGQSATGVFKGNNLPFMGVLGGIRAVKAPTKTSDIKANRSPFDAVIGGIAGQTVANAYINVYSRQVDSGMAKPFNNAFGGRVQRRADGGALQHFPSGGLVEGPGGPRSDSILATFGSGATAMVSDTEYVVQSSAVKKYGLPVLEALNRGTLKLAKGGQTKAQKQAKAEAAARNEARGDLTLSRFGYMAGWRTSEFGNALGNPGSVSALVSALNQWRSTVMKATHGKTEKDLLNILDQSGKLLLGWQKQLTKTSASLEKARDKLDGLKQAASQLAESVKSGVLNSSAITKGRQDGPVTLQSIMSGLAGSRDKSTAFTSALQQLKDKRVSPALLQQIAEAGIEGGGLETASALLKASRKDIAMMNLMQKQITIQAGLAGSITSDAVYGAEIKGQEQYVKALQSSVTSLGAKMDKLAAAMEKYIEMGLGMKATGGIIGAASGGARGSWTMVGEHEPELVRLPFGSRVYSGPDTRRMQQQAWTSMLNTPRGGGQAAGAAAPAGAQQIVVHATIEMDGQVVARQIIDPMRKEVVTRGGVRQTFGP